MILYPVENAANTTKKLWSWYYTFNCNERTYLIFSQPAMVMAMAKLPDTSSQNTKYVISVKRVRQPKHQVRHLN